MMRDKQRSFGSGWCEGDVVRYLSNSGLAGEIELLGEVGMPGEGRESGVARWWRSGTGSVRWCCRVMRVVM